MALQQVSLSGVIICPDQELEQRFAVNSFTVHLYSTIIKRWSLSRTRSADNDDGTLLFCQSVLI